MKNPWTAIGDLREELRETRQQLRRAREIGEASFKGLRILTEALPGIISEVDAAAEASKVATDHVRATVDEVAAVIREVKAEGEGR